MMRARENGIQNKLERLVERRTACECIHCCATDHAFIGAGRCRREMADAITAKECACPALALGTPARVMLMDVLGSVGKTY
jgi:hypothetical protein